MRCHAGFPKARITTSISTWIPSEQLSRLEYDFVGYSAPSFWLDITIDRPVLARRSGEHCAFSRPPHRAPHSGRRHGDRSCLCLAFAANYSAAFGRNQHDYDKFRARLSGRQWCLADYGGDNCRKLPSTSFVHRFCE